MPAPSPWVYLLAGYPNYDTGSGLEVRPVYFFSGAVPDGYLEHGLDPYGADTARVGLLQQLSTTVAIDHPLINGSAIGTTFGEITIACGGGDYDALFRPPYYWRGFPVALWRIPLDRWPGPFETYGEKVFSGVCEDRYWDRHRISLVVRDKMLQLEKRLQQRVYAGTGTGTYCEGAADLKDVCKPILLGAVTNIEPVWVDRANLVYQFHDGQHSPAEAVTKVWDQGGEIDFAVDYNNVADLILYGAASGYYSTCLTLGLFILGAAPQGTVTIDAQGDAESSGAYPYAFTDLWHKLVVRCALGYGGLSAVDVDEDILSLGYTNSVGFYSGTEPVLISDVIRQLAESGYGYTAFDRTGVLRAGAFPWADSPAATVYAHQVIDLRLDRTPMPASELRIGYQRVWHVQDPESLAQADEAHSSLVSQQYRYVQSLTGNAAKFPMAKPRTYESLLTNSGDATAVQIAAAYPQTGGWQAATLRCRGHQLERKPGEVIAIQHDRYAFSGGSDNALILSVTENLSDPDEVTTLGLMFPIWG